MLREEYWKKRFLANKALEINRVEDRINDLIKTYKKKEKEMLLEIEKFYALYARDNAINIAEAKRILTSKETNIIYEQYLKLVNASLYEKDSEAEKILQAFAKRERIDRMQELVIQLQMQLTQIYAYQEKLMQETIEQSAYDGYYKGVFATFQGTGTGTTFAYLSAKEIESLTTLSFGNSNWSKRLWGHRADIGTKIQDLISKGVFLGWSIDKMSRALVEETGQSLYNAKRLIRTESAYTYEQATLKSYAETGLEKYEFLATLDIKTSEICRKLDGKVYLRSEAETHINYPPMHPQCRSTTVPYVRDDEFVYEGTRAARDKDGKIYSVTADMKYSEWYEKYVKNDPEYLLVEKKYKNRASDKKQLAKYKSVLGSNVPKSLDKFQDLKYNSAEEWNILMRNYKLFNKIDNTPHYSEGYKKKLKDNYNYFKDNGFEFTEHGLSRVVGQKAGKGKVTFTKEQLLDVLNKPINYLQSDGKSIKFYDGISVVIANDTNEIISVVTKESTRKDWKVV